MTRPFLSVVTPTYNRRKHFAAALDCYLAQTWPLTHREWIILEDGAETVADLVAAAVAAHPGLRIRHVRTEVKATVGAKRNTLNELATGDIIVCWDDDDYYVPDRLQHIVNTMTGRKAAVVGSSAMYYYFADDGSIWLNGPFAPTHTTAGPMAYTRAYAAAHRFDESVRHAEEPAFIAGAAVAQLDPRRAILVMVHGANTYAKQEIRAPNNPASSRTGLKLRDFIRTEAQRLKYTTPSN